MLDALSTQALVTITGPGGVGKTRVALQAPDAAGDRFGEVVVVELAPLRDPEATTQLVARALDLEQRPHRSLEATVEDFLQSRDLLLVLDNCEHVVEAVAGLVDRLRARCPRLRILATGREPLGLPGEHVLMLAPLSVPGPDERSAAEVLASRRSSCSSTGPRPPAPGTRSTTRRPGRRPRSAAASTDCPSPSSWPPPGCGRSAPMPWPSASTSASPS
jgi:predicted ATPase